MTKIKVEIGIPTQRNKKGDCNEIFLKRAFICRDVHAPNHDENTFKGQF